MRCHICDRVLTEPNYNSEIEGYEPCDTCLAVIKDTLDGYLDRPSVPEDEFGEDTLVFEAYELLKADAYSPD
jgi:hypothetical protein